ncbi:divergent polysaccharide deacetylase family protein [Oceanospirillum multiglobuliferum]|uniref:divergent polysaccharide deacetylase family protein n=1 Tax=Oceanospirillum multiglobuliferum TaxID=64969 RepID=UPI0013566BEC|nr:divergent polysaccharide deacetylase family protein [Oceanospirillum multiglobuliferum]
MALFSEHSAVADSAIKATPEVPPFNPAPSIAPPSTVAKVMPSITLIIDDIGYNLRNGQRAINLPGAVTFAILPHTPYSKRLAKEAHAQGKTVMLHAPMSNLLNRQPGPGALTPSMNKEEFTTELKRSLAAIPFVQGLNNHMGSELTQDAEKMQWLMQIATEQQLFFVDSRTTAASVAADIARQNQVPHLSRDIFLDHIRTPEAVNASFDLLIKKAQQHGHIVGIGHPHSVTLDMLETRLPQLRKLGIKLISVPNRLIAEGQHYPNQQQKSAEDSDVLVAQLPLQPAQGSQPMALQPPVKRIEPEGGSQAIELQPIVRSINPAINSQLRDLQAIVHEIVVSKNARHSEANERTLYQPERIKSLPERLEEKTSTPDWVPSLGQDKPQERPERLAPSSKHQDQSLLEQPVQDPKWLDVAPVQGWLLPKNSTAETP